METLTIKVVAVEVINFGKASYVYKPTCKIGEQLLNAIIASSRKPDSKRKNFSEPDTRRATELAATRGKSLEMIVTAVKTAPRAHDLAIGSNVAGVAPTKTANADLSFL